jgi:hypothetical protein
LKCSTRLDYNKELVANFALNQIQKMPLSTRLSEIKSQLRSVEKPQAKPFESAVGGKSPRSVREVDLLCYFDWDKVKPQNKFIVEGERQLYEQVRKTETQQT